MKYTPKRSKIYLFSIFFSNQEFPQPPQKGVYNENFTTKETCPSP